jgi:hypothetical protein
MWMNAQQSLQRNQAITCGHTPNHSFALVSLSWTAFEERGAPSQLSQLQLSSKIIAFISQLGVAS